MARSHFHRIGYLPLATASPRTRVVRCVLLCAFCLPACSALSYIPFGNPANWSSSTALNAVPPQLTWSIVPDGTRKGGSEGDPLSILVSELDGDWDYTGDPAAPLAERPWFSMLDQAFTRLGSMSALTLTHEPNDDGVDVRGLAEYDGVLGTRGDIRLSGYNISAGMFAHHAGFGDITMGAQVYRGESNFNRTRHGLMHEIGHSLGLGHPNGSSTDLSLMGGGGPREFEGPQFDDVFALQKFYGDINERGLGNNTQATATELGALALGESLLIGEDARDFYIDMSETAVDGDVDFVSIQNSSDADFYRLDIEQPTHLSIELRPIGPTYANNANLDVWVSSEFNDLTLTVHNEAGDVIAQSNAGGLGQAEAIELPTGSPVWLRVAGSGQETQMYELAIDFPWIPGDFTGDGVLNLLDWQILRQNMYADTSGMTPEQLYSVGDINGDLAIDRRDFVLFKDFYDTTNGLGAFAALPAGVPEPTSAWILLMCGLAWIVAANRIEASCLF